MKTQPKIFFAFIGSRDLSKPEFAQYAKKFYQLAYRCAELGIGIRSGGANGADVIAEEAYRDAIQNRVASEDQVQIFVPWKPFQAIRGVNNPLHHLHILPSDPVLIKQAEDMVKKVHPLYKYVDSNGNPIDPRTGRRKDGLSQGAMKLHSRNMNQVFGLDLNTPITANICWTEGGIKKGGTASAITLCENNGIPVFNIGGDTNQVLSDLKTLLVSLGIQGLR